MAPYVDAIATNYNVDASDGWIADYYFDGLRKLSGGKPVLVSEWFYAARQNRTGNLNNGHLMTVDTQAERAVGAAAATENFAAIPEIVGAHWFQYYDHPKGGRPDGEDYDFGLVDIDDQPYRRLTAALAAANLRASAIHAEAAAPARASGEFVIPRAEVELRNRSLSDWPKPASLLPRLTASPGAVEFGEVYLTWSERGLQLATVGQDYFDIDLLAYDGRVPTELMPTGSSSGSMPAAGRSALRCSSFRRAPKSTTTPKWPPSCAPAGRNGRSSTAASQSPIRRRFTSAPTSRALPPRR